MYTPTRDAVAIDCVRIAEIGKVGLKGGARLWIGECSAGVKAPIEGKAKEKIKVMVVVGGDARDGCEHEGVFCEQHEPSSPDFWSTEDHFFK